jgi:hypothetical protein
MNERDLKQRQQQQSSSINNERSISTSTKLRSIAYSNCIVYGDEIVVDVVAVAQDDSLDGRDTLRQDSNRISMGLVAVVGIVGSSITTASVHMGVRAGVARFQRCLKGSRPLQATSRLSIMFVIDDIGTTKRQFRKKKKKKTFGNLPSNTRSHAAMETLLLISPASLHSLLFFVKSNSLD